MNTLQDPQKIADVGEFAKKIVETHYSYTDYWLANTFLHWDFWLSLSFTIIPWCVWFKFRKKESSNRLLFVGFFVIIVSTWMDFVGTVFGLWHYSGKVLPTIPSYIPWDYSLIPITVMLLLQYKPHISVVWKSILFAGFASFVGEPFFLWLGFYVIIKWNILYSFPIYLVIYLISHWLSRVKNFKEIA